MLVDVSEVSEPGFEVRQAIGGVSFAVHVQPGARNEGIVGVYGDAVKIAINAPAVEGQANDALVRLLSVLFHVSRGSVEIIAGHSSRSKVVRVLGLNVAQTQQVFDTALSA